MHSEREQAAELLERAADGYESGRYYWTQGRYSRMVFGNQAYCSMGALAHENGQPNGQLGRVSGAVNRAAWALSLKVDPDGHRLRGGDAVVKFNDDPLREKQEIIDAMKLAAKDLRNG